MKRYDFIPGCITFVEGRDYPIPGAESEDGLFVLYDDAMAEIAEEKKLKIFWHAMADAAEAKIAELKAELAALKSQSNLYPPCKGANCGCTDGVSHSSECFAEHEAAITGGKGFEGEA